MSNRHLIIDIGNTQSKYAIFNYDKIETLSVFKTDDLSVLQKLLSQNNFDACMLSTVVLVSKYTLNELDKYFENKPFIKLNTSVSLPIKNKYKSHTLGNDRIALAVGGHDMFPQKNKLVIDLGTCFTYDFINKKGEYYGGSISPGVDIRLKGLNQFTAKLPKITIEKDLYSYPLLGATTENSMYSGVIYGILAEIDGMIDFYKSEFQVDTIILTGGWGFYFEKRIKNKIFAVPNILVKGLNHILIYNVY